MQMGSWPQLAEQMGSVCSRDEPKPQQVGEEFASELLCISSYLFVCSLHWKCKAKPFKLRGLKLDF